MTIDQSSILIVDDVEVNRTLLDAMLRPLGFELQHAEDGAQALSSVQTSPPDLILMDLAMPVMDGPTATAHIRQLPGPAGQVPILALTANAYRHDRDAYTAAKNGFVDAVIARLGGPPRKW